MYRVIRRRGLLRNEVNVISASKKNDISKRATEYTVYGRAGDNKTGSSRSRARTSTTRCSCPTVHAWPETQDGAG